MIVPLYPAIHRQPDVTDAPEEPGGQETLAQVPVYIFELTLAVTAVIVPLYPRLQRHPLPKLVPLLNAGQTTGKQAPTKYGLLVVAVIMPLNPALQEQPPSDATSLLLGQIAKTQLPIE